MIQKYNVIVYLQYIPQPKYGSRTVPSLHSASTNTYTYALKTGNYRSKPTYLPGHFRGHFVAEAPWVGPYPHYGDLQNTYVTYALKTDNSDLSPPPGTFPGTFCCGGPMGWPGPPIWAPKKYVRMH